MTFDNPHFNSLKEWISHLPGVTSGPHRFGGTEYKVLGLEFMHFHGQKHLDIRLSMQDQKRVLTEGMAEQHLYAPQARLVILRIRCEDNIQTAKQQVRLAYDNARRARTLETN